MLERGLKVMRVLGWLLVLKVAVVWVLVAFGSLTMPLVLVSGLSVVWLMGAGLIALLVWYGRRQQSRQANSASRSVPTARYEGSSPKAAPSTR